MMKRLILGLTILVFSEIGFAEQKPIEVSSAAPCPFATKSCQNPHDSGSQCGALTVTNAKRVLGSTSQVAR